MDCRICGATKGTYVALVLLFNCALIYAIVRSCHTRAALFLKHIHNCFAIEFLCAILYVVAMNEPGSNLQDARIALPLHLLSSMMLSMPCVEMEMLV